MPFRSKGYNALNCNIVHSIKIFIYDLAFPIPQYAPTSMNKGW